MRLFLITCLTLASSQHFAAETVDGASGLIVAPGWEHVRAHCGACHSHQLVTSNRGNKERWLASIRWMQKKHNLWPLAPKVEQSILEYLASQYPAPEPSRRKNLEPALMP